MVLNSLPLEREFEQHDTNPQFPCNFRWSEIAATITWTYEVDEIIEDSASTSEDSKKNSNYYKSPTYTPLVAPTASREHHQILECRCESASTSTNRLFKSQSPSAADERPKCEALSPPSRLSPETLLTVAWPVPMRVLPLTLVIRSLSYRPRHGMCTTRCKAAAWWRQISTKCPSKSQIRQACGDYKLVYLRTTNIESASGLKTILRQHHSYRLFYLLAISKFGENLWEVLLKFKCADQLKACAEACHCVIRNECHPRMPFKQYSRSWNRFKPHMRAREQLLRELSLLS